MTAQHEPWLQNLEMVMTGMHVRRHRRIPRPRAAAWVLTALLGGVVACGDYSAGPVMADSPRECMDQIFQGLDRSADGNPIQLSHPTVEAMAASYGFAYGQAASVEEARRQHPSLGVELELAQMEFEQRFAPSLQVIDSVLLSLGPEWREQRRQIRQELDERAASQTISVEEATRFIEIVSARRLGQEDVAYVQTLLAYHPRYRESPSEELTDGIRRVYTTDGSGRSAGVRLRLQVPVSWVGRAGERPNIVRAFISEGGRGTETFLVQVRDLDLADMDGNTAEELVQDPTLARQLMAGSAFTELCSARTMLDGLPAQALYMRGTMGSPSAEIEQIAVAYVTVVGEKLGSLQGGVGAEGGSGDALLRRFQVFAPAFGLMASSVVFEDRW